MILVCCLTCACSWLQLTVTCRDTIPGPTRHRLLAARQLAPCPLVHSYCAPRCCFHDADLLWTRCCCPLPLARPFATVLARAAHLHLPYASGIASGLPRRYPALRSPRGLGRVDCVSSHHHHCCKRHRDMCHAQDPGQSQSKEEAYCRERRHEWSDILCEPAQRCESNNRLSQGRVPTAPV